MSTELLRIVLCFFYQMISEIQMSDMFVLRGARKIGDNVYGNG